MIGRAHRAGTDFMGLGVYLDGNQPDRVDWVESRNLPTRDLECAARLMTATARDSERVRKPVYHLSISFDPGDPVDRETMRRVADRTLRDLGLQGHQAVLVAHRDRQHPHVHIMVNRVHPERGTAWSNSWDYRRIEASLRQQEVELGLRVVPGRHAPVPEHARDRVPERAPERVRGDAAFVERVRAEAGPHLTAARSWAELERGLGGHGLALRMKGRGMVVTDGVREVKASEIDAAASRFRLERRFLDSFTDYRARQAVAGRALDERTRRVPAQVQERTPAPAEPERGAIPTGINREQRTPEMHRAPAPTPADLRPPPAPAERHTRPRTFREAAREFSREARALYVDPAAARHAFLSAAARRGADRAAATFRDESHRFGRLRPGADPARSDRAADAAFEYARQRAASDRAPLKQAAALLREAHDSQRGAIRAVDVQGNIREAASRLMAAQIGKGPEKAAQLAARLAPMVPASAAQLVRQAFDIGKTLAVERDREREREIGLSR
ncbi:MAG TPA: relaxase/mobilization nuclease domain-containing protein [Longimicrobium sp.]|nr:relaxase/mobilization nuclease domain-containing protein [Longimicrobium sp.]